MMANSGLAVLALRRTGVRLPMLLGSVVVSVSMVAMVAGRPNHLDPVWWLCVTAACTGVGMGMAIPASNNALLQSASNDVAPVAGLRRMFRQAGGVLTVAVAITAVSTTRTAPAATRGLIVIFVLFSVLLLASIPMVFRIPDHRGRLTCRRTVEWACLR
jgi:MFS family permease